MVLISKCCAGIKCRYRHNGFFRQFLEALGEEQDFIAICPEMKGGLPLPREGCSVKGKKIIGRKTGADYTKEVKQKARAANPFLTRAVAKTQSEGFQFLVKILKKEVSDDIAQNLIKKIDIDFSL